MATASVLALLLLAILIPLQNVSAVGVSYGTLGNNFPSPKKVLIDKVEIYHTDPEILEEIDLIIAVENYHVANISTDTSAADEWFTDRVMSFIPVTSIVPLLLVMSI
ncbi:hypothetical protein NC651_014608 [Populus alba x Populus x berolinensis]|nr:hypothetical protein NC651_014608 [Populus alba x Populus x berolinensis]